jgi:uncharacterized protein YxeA
MKKIIIFILTFWVSACGTTHTTPENYYGSIEPIKTDDDPQKNNQNTRRNSPSCQGWVISGMRALGNGEMACSYNKLGVVITEIENYPCPLAPSYCRK